MKKNIVYLVLIFANLYFYPLVSLWWSTIPLCFLIVSFYLRIKNGHNDFTQKEKDMLASALVESVIVHDSADRKKRNKARGNRYEQEVREFYESLGFSVYSDEKLDFENALDLICYKEDIDCLILVQCKDWSESSERYKLDYNQLREIYLKNYKCIQLIVNNYTNENKKAYLSVSIQLLCGGIWVVEDEVFDSVYHELVQNLDVDFYYDTLVKHNDGEFYGTLVDEAVISS